MIRIKPRALIAIGLLLVLFGFVAPFLMVVRIVEPSLALSFASHAASVSGLFLGIIGSAIYVRSHRN
jgi:hypothetical protein